MMGGAHARADDGIAASRKGGCKQIALAATGKCELVHNLGLVIGGVGLRRDPPRRCYASKPTWICARWRA
jgi:hypothetical protein